MHSKGKVSMYKPGTRPGGAGVAAALAEKDNKDKSTDEDDFVQTNKKWWYLYSKFRFNIALIDANIIVFKFYYIIKQID